MAKPAPGTSSSTRSSSSRCEIAPLRPDRIALRSGASVDAIAFYCPGSGPTPCDLRTGGGPFANFWPLAPSHIEVAHGGTSGRFTNSEAAYHALKWWQHAPTRVRFEACDAAGLAGGEQAFALKRALERDGEMVAKSYCDRLDKWDAMLLVLRAKWRLPAFRELLVSSAGCLIVEHSAKARAFEPQQCTVGPPPCTVRARPDDRCCLAGRAGRPRPLLDGRPRRRWPKPAGRRADARAGRAAQGRRSAHRLACYRAASIVACRCGRG